MKQPLYPGVVVLALLVSFHVADADKQTEAVEGLRPLITTSELVVGQNRFAFGLLRAQKLFENADVKVRVYSIEGKDAHLTAELRAPFYYVESVERGSQVHRHTDGTQHVHTAGTDVQGLYLTQVAFARPGPWGIEILAREKDGPTAMARASVMVLGSPRTPPVGSPAPRSRNLIATDVKELREIDTSDRPDPRLHQVRIADAIAQGKPQIIVFATPRFCTSRTCGSVVDIVRKLYPVYGHRMAFTHQEIWQDFASKQVFTTLDEWGLRSEPWIFVVDEKGIIRAKFEGLVTVRELEAALQQILMKEPGRQE